MGDLHSQSPYPDRASGVRVRFLTREQAQIFIAALTQPWMQSLCRFALLTGMRLGEITSLTWEKVDLHRSVAWVSADRAKSGSSRVVPLNPEALGILKTLQAEKPATPRDVLIFTRGTDKRVGELARTKRHAALCVERARRLEIAGNGQTLRASCARTSGAVRGRGHVLVRF